MIIIIIENFYTVPFSDVHKLTELYIFFPSTFSDIKELKYCKRKCKNIQLKKFVKTNNIQQQKCTIIKSLYGSSAVC